MSAYGNGKHESALCAVAQSCADETELAGLSLKLGHAVREWPGLSLVGLAVFDDERHAVQRHTVHLAMDTGSPSIRAEPTLKEDELPVDDTEIPELLAVSIPYVIADLAQPDRPAFCDHLCAKGASHYVSVPIRLKRRLLGTLYAGISNAGEVPQDILSAYTRLAQIVTPALYNCINHARFASGDRRRDALIELSSVVNASLEMDKVLAHARRVIGGLEGHCFSSICILNDNDRTYRSYQTMRVVGSDKLMTPDPTVHQVSGSILEHLLEHGTTYESEDLDKECRFHEDHDARKHGAGRLIAIPLVARGRILGGFMFGTPDPRPRRKVEYWLYENIALQLALAVDNAGKHEQLQRLTQELASHNAYLEKEIRSERGHGLMIGETPIMKAMQASIRQVAATDATVLITGETGVGKELVARQIHERSSRSGHPLIKVNCPGIPEGMFESELFGHERGAFTSAVERRIGRFELARDGTLFLDEIGELSPDVQAKLLRVLQDGEFERVGGSKTLSSNARIIVATNRDLPRAINDGRFRADLYFRLNVFPIHVPPLRDRRADLPALVDAFVAEFSQRLGKRIDGVNDESMEELCSRDWPGNIRELRHTIERAVILSHRPRLHVAPLLGAFPPMTEVNGVTSPDNPVSLDSVQAEHIRRALDSCGGVIEGAAGAAAMLGINPSTLRYRMKRLGIQRLR